MTNAMIVGERPSNSASTIASGMNGRTRKKSSIASITRLIHPLA